MPDSIYVIAIVRHSMPESLFFVHLNPAKADALKDQLQRAQQHGKIMRFAMSDIKNEAIGLAQFRSVLDLE